MTDSATMSPANEKLRPLMHEFLDIDGRERLYACWNRIWISTPSTKEAFIGLQDCLNAAHSTKPRGLVITGDSDTGKSRTLTAFRDAHPPIRNPESQFAEFPVLYITAPDNPSRRAVLKKILEALGHPLLYNTSEEDLKAFTIRMLKGCRVGTIIIDELHDIQQGLHSVKIGDFLRFIKNLINESGRPFVVAGTPIVLDLIEQEEQMVGRLNTVIKLKPFTMNEFVLILLAFERMLPLRYASNFDKNEPAIQFAFNHSQGFIGRLSYLLHDACQVAIESGEERITLDVLQKVQDRSIRAVGRRI